MKTSYKYLWDTAKAALRGKFRFLKHFVNKGLKSIISCSTLKANETQSKQIFIDQSQEQ